MWVSPGLGGGIVDATYGSYFSRKGPGSEVLATYLLSTALRLHISFLAREIPLSPKFISAHAFPTAVLVYRVINITRFVTYKFPYQQDINNQGPERVSWLMV